MIPNFEFEEKVGVLMCLYSSMSRAPRERHPRNKKTSTTYFGPLFDLERSTCEAVKGSWWWLADPYFLTFDEVAVNLPFNVGVKPKLGIKGYENKKKKVRVGKQSALKKKAARSAKRVVAGKQRQLETERALQTHNLRSSPFDATAVKAKDPIAYTVNHAAGKEESLRSTRIIQAASTERQRLESRLEAALLREKTLIGKKWEKKTLKGLREVIADLRRQLS